MSAAAASAAAAPSNATPMRVSGARLRDRGAAAALAGLVRADVARASVAVEAQQRFLAYAAHELRGEIALQRALAEVTLANPNADPAALREMGERVVAACERQQRLLEALLTLAGSAGRRLRHEPVDLAATAVEVLRAHDHHGLTSTTAPEPARTTGDPQLVERLVANLVANAVRHNVPGGRFDVATYTVAGRAIFTIANTGPRIPAGELTRLFQPFQRLSAHPRPPADGVGLGLAIVQAIASAHDASLTAQPRTGGGLRIDVAFAALD
jgi:signal transduction histidine kinase